MFLCRRGRSFFGVALFCFSCLLFGAQAQDELARKSHDAKELMSAGRFADAVPLYQDLLKALPANPGLRPNLALAYHMSGQHALAVPEFERVLKVDPASVPALLSLSVSLLELNQPAKALPYLQKMIALQPSHVEARGMLANVLLSLERPAEAAVQFRKLTTLTPDDPKAWYGLGRSYEGIARKSFETLDKTAQGSPEWLTLVADSRMERRQYRSAFFFYKQALDKKPDLPGVHRAIAEIYRQSEHADWAAVEARKEPTVAKMDCVRNKQACDFVAGRFVEAAAGPSAYWKAKAANELALAAFKKLGTLPASVELHAIRAEILSSHQQYVEAVQEWEAARALAPRDPQIAKQLAIALYQGADYAKAIPMLSELVKQDPTLAFFLGDAFLKSEKAEQAIPWLSAVVRADPSFAPARASLGLAYARTHDDPKAIEHLMAALPSDEDGSLHYQLAQAYQRTGAREKAAEILAKYQEIRGKLEAGQKSVEEQAVITAPSQ